MEIASKYEILLYLSSSDIIVLEGTVASQLDLKSLKLHALQESLA
jgi:hypothetical protein